MFLVLFFGFSNPFYSYWNNCAQCERLRIYRFQHALKFQKENGNWQIVYHCAYSFIRGKSLSSWRWDVSAYKIINMQVVYHFISLCVKQHTCIRHANGVYQYHESCILHACNMHKLNVVVVWHKPNQSLLWCVLI